MSPWQRIKSFLAEKWYWFPVWILVLLLVLVVGLLIASSLPPGADFNYPLRWMLIRLVRVLTVPISAALLFSVLIIPAFVIWSIKQLFARRSQPNQSRIMSSPFFALFIAALLGFALAVIVAPYVDIQRIDSTPTATHYYYLDANMTQSDGSEYYLYECDADGVICRLRDDHDTRSLRRGGNIRLVLDGEDLHIMTGGDIYHTYYGAGR